MGAWIETRGVSREKNHVASHPMWVRGLKQEVNHPKNYHRQVAPHVGAWIETLVKEEISNKLRVAPHVGAWIETKNTNLFLILQ